MVKMSSTQASFEYGIIQYAYRFVHRYKRNSQGQRLCFLTYGILSEYIKRILTPFNIRTAFRAYKTLMLVHPKDRVAKNQKSGIEYNVTCRDCEKVYVCTCRTDRPFCESKNK